MGGTGGDTVIDETEPALAKLRLDLIPSIDDYGLYAIRYWILRVVCLGLCFIPSSCRSRKPATRGGSGGRQWWISWSQGRRDVPATRPTIYPEPLMPPDAAPRNHAFHGVHHAQHSCHLRARSAQH